MLVVMFVVHWTICEKLDEDGIDARGRRQVHAAQPPSPVQAHGVLFGATRGAEPSRPRHRVFERLNV
jgi:hypothetical protein